MTRAWSISLSFGVALVRRISLWQLIAMGIVGIAMWDGTGYLVKGNSIAKGGSFAFMRDVLPGGMHTHGLIMLVLAGLIIYTMHDRPKQATWAMWAVFLYSVFLVCALIWGWVISKEITWSAPSKWFFVAWAAFVLQVKIDEFNYEQVPQKNGD